MMMNMSEIRFETSFIIDILTSYTISVQHGNVYQWYTFSCLHQAFSVTWKCIPVLRNFVPIITLSVQHGSVYQRYTFSCPSSRFQFNTEMCTSGIHFRASCGVISSRGLISVNFDQRVTTQLCSRAILEIPALPRLAQIVPSVKQW